MAVIRVPFDIDEAKLTPPVLRPASVKKADAISALLTSSAPIATVTAPAGYGKTTLLGRWAEVDPRGFAWVALDARDDDELVFLRGIAAAIHRVEPIAKSVFDALSGPGGSIWNRVPRVGNAFAALTRPIVVALDDLHAVTSPSCLSVLAALVDYVPPGSQIVVTSREKPALPLARWRSRGLLLELGTEDLRLEPWEADLLLRGASVALEAADVATLTQQTEGWPAGLYLAALSFRSGAPDLPGVKAISGDDRFVSEYFRQEVMSRLPMSEAQFAMRTSVLETLNGSLCDAVLETQGSAQVLDALERSNRFVVPLDNRGEQYRYHHLFRQLLRLELERREPQLIDQLNRRAMAWYADHDQPERAVAFGQAAHATAEVAALVDQVALPVHYDGRMSTLEELLDWFDADDMTRFPAIAVYAAWVQAMTGRATEAGRLLSIADGATSSIPLSDGSPTIEPWVATLRAAMMPHGVEAALVDADTALAQLSASSAWRSDATVMRGIARALLGSNDDAAADLQAASDLAVAAGAVDTQFVAQAELALLHARRGAWFEAQRHAQGARAVVEQAHLEHYGLAAIAHVAVARVAIHRHHHGDARAAMTRAHKLRPLMDHALPWLTVQVGIELTRAHLALGEVDAARTILDETSRVLARRPNLGTLVDEVREMRALVAASSGEGAWAVNLTGAELRLLPYLATYLTFPEIAGQLFITSHTVRSEAKAIYRKLDATSRAEAIERAVDVGLLEPMFPHRASVAS